jgi:thiol:disulfide interchange protein DsbD
MYLLGKLRFSHDSELKSVSVPRFFLALFSLSFAMYLIPGLWGAPLKSISAFAPPLSTQDFNLYGGVFREFDDYDEGMKYAEENHMPVLVDFSGFACVNCRKMEGAVFDTPQVREIIEGNFVLIKLMVDDKTELSKPYSVKENGKNITIETIGEKWSYLQRHKFSTNSQPYYVILDNEGNPMGEAQVYNEDVDNFVNWLNNGLETYSAK